jgi:translation initiation factor 2 alpha subunit (eIF-2alpha)
METLGTLVGSVPVDEEVIYRVEFMAGTIEHIEKIDKTTREIQGEPDNFFLFPAEHFVSSEEEIERATKSIEHELEERLKEFLDDEVVDEIQNVARENIDLKQEKFEGEIEIEFNSGDGVEKIKECFKRLGEGVEAKYVSAPEYSITSWGRTQELAKKRMDEAVEKIKENAKEKGGSFNFSRA